LDRLVDLDVDHEFIGKDALRRIRDTGVSRRQVGVIIHTEPFAGPNTSYWPIAANGQRVGQVTSAVWSPRLQQNIALAMVSIAVAEPGQSLVVETDHGPQPATVVDTPFFDPRKSLATGSS